MFNFGGGDVSLWMVYSVGVLKKPIFGGVGMKKCGLDIVEFFVFWFSLALLGEGGCNRILVKGKFDHVKGKFLFWIIDFDEIRSHPFSFLPFFVSKITVLPELTTLSV